MKLLSSPKLNYLLSAGLDVLHDESGEWLSEIVFWQDEAVFLKHLIKDKAFGILPGQITDGLRKAESELEEIAGTKLPELRKNVEQHERYLGFLLEEKSNDQESYRQKHKDLSQQVRQLASRFKEIKKDVFELIEQVMIVRDVRMQ